MERLGRRQRGFTLVELMVVLVIVALMAAISVPLYTNYVKDARRCEAAGGLAAVATAEVTYYQKNLTYANALSSLNVDLTDLGANWTFGAPTVVTGPPLKFTCVATGKTGTPYAGLTVTLTYTLGGAKTLVDENGKTM